MIHTYKLNGYNIVIDAASGSVHCVDNLAYDVINRFEEKTASEIISELCGKYGSAAEQDIVQTMADIKELIQAGTLFSKDTFGDIADMRPKTRPVIKALCLHVSHLCNMTCGYCFAGQGEYHGQSGLMSLETGKRAIDFLIENSAGRKNLEVDFFGGEPLLNWDIVKQIVGYAREREVDCGKNFRFTLTTNGLLIDDDVIEFSNREMHNVVLSLDGRKETHDRLRKNTSGGGSYDEIVPKFQKFVDLRDGKGYYIRGTFTKQNPDFTNDIFHMAELGFKELSMEPVVSSQEDEFSLGDAELERIKEQYELLAAGMLKRQSEGRGFTFYHFMIDLKNGPCVYKRISGCGSGTEYLAVTPQGELFPCHQFVGIPEFLVGNIWDGVTTPAVCEEFSRCNIYSKNECKTCWARLYCSGGCAANAFHSTGSIDGIYEFGCEIFKKRMECAIMMKVAEKLSL